MIRDRELINLIVDSLEYQLAWPQIEKDRPFKSPALQAICRS